MPEKEWALEGCQTAIAVEVPADPCQHEVSEQGGRRQPSPDSSVGAGACWFLAKTIDQTLPSSLTQSVPVHCSTGMGPVLNAGFFLCVEETGLSVAKLHGFRLGRWHRGLADWTCETGASQDINLLSRQC